MTFFHHLPSRREALLGAGTLFAWSQMPKLARAEGRDPRLLVIVLRGALDGLGAVAPVGDPDWIGLRGDRALVLDGKPPALPLDGFFALNPAMPNLHRLYKARQATIVHATATPYRERSHFDGQDVLESGIARPGARRYRLAQSRAGSNWPRTAGSICAAAACSALARSPRWWYAAARRCCRGCRNNCFPPATTRRPACWICISTPIRDWRPRSRRGYGWRRSARHRHRTLRWPTAPPLAAPGIAGVRAYFAEAAGTAARFLAKPDGPRVGAMGFVGWDTHINEGAASGQLANLLGALDGALAAIETNMGDAWRETVVAVITEFGRTARINGTNGTDHGTGTVAFLAGGALRGGRVVADWPGLKSAQLYEERDLKPTTDLRAVLKGLLSDHLRVDERVLASTVFPDSTDVAPTSGLVG